MKKNKFLYHVIAILVFSLSCSNQDAINDQTEVIITKDSFEPLRISSIQPTNDLEASVLFPSGIYVQDSMLVVVEQSSRDEIIKLYNVDELSLLTSFGAKGEGPDEFSDSPTVLQPQLIKKNTLELYDWSKKRILGVRLDTLINKEEFFTSYEFLLPPEVMDAQEAGKIGENLYVASGFLSNGYVAFINENTLEINYIPFDDVEELEDVTIQEKKWFFNVWPAINTSHQKIVLGMERFNRVLIYNFDGTLHKNIRFNEYKPDFKAKREDIPYYYTRVFTTEKYIYAAWLGKSVTEIEEQLNRGEAPESEIHVFDWDGNPVKRLNLEENFVSTFSIDARNNRILIINELSDDFNPIFFESNFIQ